MQILSKLMKKKWGVQTQLNIDHMGTQGLVYIAEDGWDKDKYENREGYVRWPGTSYESTSGVTKGKQIRFSLNSPLRLTIDEWRELNKRIEDEWLNILNLSNPKP